MIYGGSTHSGRNSSPIVMKVGRFTLNKKCTVAGPIDIQVLFDITINNVCKEYTHIHILCYSVHM